MRLYLTFLVDAIKPSYFDSSTALTLPIQYHCIHPSIHVLSRRDLTYRTAVTGVRSNPTTINSRIGRGCSKVRNSCYFSQISNFNFHQPNHIQAEEISKWLPQPTTKSSCQSRRRGSRWERRRRWMSIITWVCFLNLAFIQFDSMLLSLPFGFTAYIICW